MRDAGHLPCKSRSRLRAKLDELVKVKAAVAAANAELYDAIFRLAELNAEIQSLQDALDEFNFTRSVNL